MRKEVKKVLFKLLSQLKEDEIARDLMLKLLCYQGAVEDLSVQDIVGLKAVEVESDMKWPMDTDGFLDARICSLKFTNFRAFPDDRYGISFCREENDREYACSLFLVGGNSNGKSTICDALEYVYTGDVAAIHRLKGIEPQKYLSFGFEDGKVKKEDVSLTLTTMLTKGKSKIELASTVEPVCTAVCFCSDNDVEEMERSDEYIEDYLLSQLGYGELALLKKKMDEITESINDDLKRASTSPLEGIYIKKIIAAYLSVHHLKGERNKIKAMLKDGAISKLVKDIRTTNDKISKNVNTKDRISSIRQANRRIPKDYFVEEWNILISNIVIEEQGTTKVKRPYRPLAPGSKAEKSSGENTPSPVKTLQDRIQLMYERLNKALSEDDGLDNLYKELAEVSASYSGLADSSSRKEDLSELSVYAAKLSTLSIMILDEMESICEGFYKEHHAYLTDTMNSFSPSTETFSLSHSGGHLTARIHCSEKGGFSSSAKAYYNTFRFKLYVIALKLSLAFLYMRTSKTVVPIVIDDVFNATDFDNSIKLERFVYNIYKTYEEKVKSGIPLQLIVLTHDEMVMTAFRKGAKLMREQEMATSGRQSKYVVGNDFICGRLFHYTQAESLKEYCKVNGDFTNLYLPI